MHPLAAALGASVVFYEGTWWKVQQRSWSLGKGLRTWGQKVYGSEWNSLVPVWDEFRLAGRMLPQQDIAHFLWGEFAAPKTAQFRRKAKRIVATYHASASRLPTVLSGCRAFKQLDGITLMSETQKSYFIEQGIPEERIAVILHGMDSSYFHPAEQRTGEPGEPLRGFMIGVTERDHAFLAEVCRALPPGLLNLSVATSRDQQVHYQGLSGVTLLPRLDDPGLLRTYQQSDLLLMPVMDCTANNSILESMACGTPVMTNRIGGVPEYVPDEYNVVMPEKKLNDWVDRLRELAKNRNQLETMRPRVRAWAQSLDWHTVAGHYHSFYQELKGMR